jgi:predicted O-linked N-acetylglucosamine transferase (SPINDLY family)
MARNANIPPKAMHAKALLDQGRAAEAADLLRRLVHESPKEVAAYGALCQALIQIGQPTQALYYAKQARRLAPEMPETWATEARALQYSKKTEDALKLLLEARGKFPRDASVGDQLCDFYLFTQKHASIDALCSKAAEEGWISPGMETMHAGALHKLGDLRRATEWARKRAWENPRNPELASMYAKMLLYDANATPEQMAAALKRVGTMYHDIVEADVIKHAAKDDPERPLRVGVLSPDLRQHSVAAFAGGLLEGVRAGGDRLHVFYSGYSGDALTKRFASQADWWLTCGELGPRQLRDAIAEQRIDVLFELSGHTTNHRLGTIAMKPAPVIISAIGYPATTGLRAVDYRLVDEVTDPIGCEGLMSEKPLRIDAPFLCYEPPGDAPDVEPTLACEREGRVTFAAFNAMLKLNDATLELWAKVLKATPGSRLLVKSVQSQDGETNDSAAARFERAGIPKDRMEWLPHTAGQREHLAVYNRCDIALDPFPYHGTTTTCEAMLMGVPTVSLVGRAHVGRVGLTLARAVGNQDLCTDTPEAFVATATQLAKDVERLRHERETLRGRLLGGALCDRAGYALRIARAIRAVWCERCRSQ